MEVNGKPTASVGDVKTALHPAGADAGADVFCFARPTHVASAMDTLRFPRKAKLAAEDEAPLQFTLDAGASSILSWLGLAWLALPCQIDDSACCLAARPRGSLPV